MSPIASRKMVSNGVGFKKGQRIIPGGGMQIATWRASLMTRICVVTSPIKESVKGLAYQEHERHAVAILQRNGLIPQPPLAELARGLPTDTIHFPGANSIAAVRVRRLYRAIFSGAAPESRARSR